MNSSKTITVEMTVAGWSRFSKSLKDVYDNLDRKALKLAHSNYIPVMGVDQERAFREKGEALIEATKHRFLLQKVRKDINQSIKEKRVKLDLSDRHYTTSARYEIEKLEKIIFLQTSATLSVEDIDKPGARDTYAETQDDSQLLDPSIYYESGCDIVLPSVKNMTIGIPIRILTEQDIDYLKAQIKRVRNDEFKNRSLRSEVSKKKLKLVLPEEMAQYLPK